MHSVGLNVPNEKNAVTSDLFSTSPFQWIDDATELSLWYLSMESFESLMGVSGPPAPTGGCSNDRPNNQKGEFRNPQKFWFFCRKIELSFPHNYVQSLLNFSIKTLKQDCKWETADFILFLDVCDRLLPGDFYFSLYPGFGQVYI